MVFQSFIINVVCCAVMEILAGVILPDGKMKALSMQVISMFLLYSLVVPICEFIK